MAEWCQKCGTYHDITTAGGCPDKEDKLWVGTYAEGFRAGQESAERRAGALEAEIKQLDSRAGELTSRLASCLTDLAHQEAEAERLRDIVRELLRAGCAPRDEEKYIEAWYDAKTKAYDALAGRTLAPQARPGAEALEAALESELGTADKTEILRREQVTALEAELKHLDSRAGELTSWLASCRRDLSISEAEYRRLREAFKRYGRHNEYCGYTFDPQTQTSELGPECTCGFEAIAAALSPQAGRSGARGREQPDCFRNDWDRARWALAGKPAQEPPAPEPKEESREHGA